MKSGKRLCWVLSGFILLISACNDGKDETSKKADFSGVSNLISERNSARYDAADNPTPKQAQTRAATGKSKSASSKDEELATTILYEQKVNIVGSDSGRTLANGVAYINKKGQIVRIKITRE